MTNGKDSGAAGLSGGRSHRLEQLEPRSLADQAYKAIRRSIIDGRFGLGERLVETRLAEEMGVSRAPIREALKRLANEQLVVEKPRYGYFVREFKARDFVDIYNLLSTLEILAVRLIVRNGIPLDPLEKIVEEMYRAAGEGDFVRLVDEEVRFHEELCAAAGNRYLNEVFRSLSGLVRLALSLDDATNYDDLNDIAAEHVPLLEAFREGTEEQAVFAIQHHICASLTGSPLKKIVMRLGGNPDDVLGPLNQSGISIRSEVPDDSQSR